MLPATARFQGLELPNINVDILCRKIYCITNHWGEESITGNLLKQAYEVFQVIVGLPGSIFDWYFKELEPRATHGWFKHLWQLCRKYNVNFQMHSDFDIPLSREGDWTIMEETVKMNIYSSDQLAKINRVRKFKSVHFMANIILRDNISMNHTMLVTRTPSKSKWKSTIEKPINDDFNMWISVCM